MLSNEPTKNFLIWFTTILVTIFNSKNSNAFPNLDVHGCGEVAPYIAQSMKDDKVVVVTCDNLLNTGLELKAAVFPPRKLNSSSVCSGKIEKRIYEPVSNEYYFGVLDVSGYVFESSECRQFRKAHNIVYVADLMSDRVVETLFENRGEIKKNITNVGGLCKDKDQLDLKKIAIGSLSDKNDFTYLMYFSDVNSKNSNYKCVAAVDIDGGSEVSIVGVEVLMD